MTGSSPLDLARAAAVLGGTVTGVAAAEIGADQASASGTAAAETLAQTGITPFTAIMLAATAAALAMIMVRVYKVYKINRS
jgi:hypothetical protein